MIRRLLRFGGILGLALAILAFPLAYGADAFFGKDVWMVQPKAPELVVLERSQWKEDRKPGAPADEREVAGLYGAPLSKERVLFPDKARLVTPEEAPGTTLLEVKKSEGENPLQAKTVFLFARYTAIGGALAAVAAFLLLRLTRPRPPA